MRPSRITPKITSEFFYNQLERWPMANLNYDLLENAIEGVEEIYFEKRFWNVEKFIVQYRKESLSANIDTAIKGLRPCFLCDNARPDEQCSLDWDDYEILVNPYPLSLPHFTIAGKSHTPQLIKGHFSDMLRMTRLFEECCVFYNGPFCGASAPDHLHFQAFDIYNFRNIYQALRYGTTIAREGHSCVRIPARNMYAAPFILLDTTKDHDAITLFNRVTEALPPADPEPMMNIVAAKYKSHTLVAIFPRRKHRPDCYGPEEGSLLVSPASAEMLGTFPCAGTKEFNALDEKTIQDIYDEVCVGREEFELIIERIKE